MVRDPKQGTTQFSGILPTFFVFNSLDNNFPCGCSLEMLVPEVGTSCKAFF